MGKTLKDLVNDKFGVSTRPVLNPVIQTVDANELMLFNNNPNRFAFLVMNLSGNILYILPDNGVTANRGIRLNANGGQYIAIYDQDFDMVGYSWFCIGSAPGTTLLSLEIVGD